MNFHHNSTSIAYIRCRNNNSTAQLYSAAYTGAISFCSGYKRKFFYAADRSAIIFCSVYRPLPLIIIRHRLQKNLKKL